MESGVKEGIQSATQLQWQLHMRFASLAFRLAKGIKGLEVTVAMSQKHHRKVCKRHTQQGEVFETRRRRARQGSSGIGDFGFSLCPRQAPSTPLRPQRQHVPYQVERALYVPRDEMIFLLSEISRNKMRHPSIYCLLYDMEQHC